MNSAGAKGLQGLRVSIGVGHVNAWSFAESAENQTPPKARIVAEGRNHLAAEEAAEPVKKALLLECEAPLRYEGLDWRFVIATIRYVEEPFESLALGKPITSYVRYVPASAVDS